MKRIILVIFTLFLPLSMYAFHYRPEIDGEGGLFFVTGDDAISGIFILIGCAIIAFVCYKIAEVIDKNEESKGIRNTVAMVLYIIGTIAVIAAIGFAFALWWIMLTLFIIAIVGVAIYQKFTDEKQYNMEIKNQETNKKEENNSELPIEQKKKNQVSDNSNYPSIEKIEKEKYVLIKQWTLISFAKEFGLKMQIGTFTFSNNIKIKYCVFTNTKGTKTYVIFFYKLGELTAQEIRDKKDILFVGQMSSNKFYLYANNTQLRNKTITKNNNIYIAALQNSNALTDPQKNATLVFLSVFTDRTVEKEIEYKRLLGVDDRCVTHYPLKERMLYGGSISTDTKNEYFEIMSSIRDKSIIDKFIFYSCNSCHFLERKENINEFNCILMNWGYTQEEVSHLINYSKLMQEICSKAVIDYMDINEYKSYISQELHDKGFNYDESSAIEYLDSIYDGGTDFEIHLLTNTQKFALFGWFVQMSRYNVISNRIIKVKKLRQFLAYELKIKEKDCNRILQNNSFSRYDYAEIVKTIQLDAPLNIFFSAWRDLIHLEKGYGSIYGRYVQAFKLLGYSKDDLIQSLNGIDVYKH